MPGSALGGTRSAFATTRSTRQLPRQVTWATALRRGSSSRRHVPPLLVVPDVPPLLVEPDEPSSFVDPLPVESELVSSSVDSPPPDPAPPPDPPPPAPPPGPGKVPSSVATGGRSPVPLQASAAKSAAPVNIVRTMQRPRSTVTSQSASSMPRSHTNVLARKPAPFHARCARRTRETSCRARDSVALPSAARPWTIDGSRAAGIPRCDAMRALLVTPLREPALRVRGSRGHGRSLSSS